MNHVSIILGYGVYLEPDPNYKKYLDTALLKTISLKPDLIITCGGHTNKEYHHLSEAETIKDLYLKSNPELDSKIYPESQSLTTAQNLESSLAYLKQNKFSPSVYSIFCDSVRSPKVFYLMLTLLYPQYSEKQRLEIITQNYFQYHYELTKETTISYQNLTVYGIPLSDTMEMAAHQIISSMLEMHAFDYPDLHQRLVDYRKELWDVK